MGRKWSEEEERWLLDNYDGLGAEECARRLGRSRKAVFNKMYRLRGGGIEEAVEVDKKVEALRTELKVLKRKYMELLRVSGFFSDVIDVIRKEVSAWPPVPIPDVRAVEPERPNDTVLLLLSDLHIDEVVRADETWGLARYDFDVFRYRLQYLSDKMWHILFECMTGYQFERLVIACLGDFVSGVIHDELVETSGMTVVEQALRGAYVLAQFFREQAARFKSVAVYTVSGNHGRLTKQRRFKRRYADWDRVLYETVGMILKDQENVEFRFSNAPFALFEINGARFLMEHGDAIRMWMGFPWYGVERERIRKKELVEGIAEVWDARNKNVGTFQYMLLGHFHQCGQIDAPKGEVFINGSMIGGSEYSIGNLGRSHQPTQLLLGVNKKGLVSFRYPLRLGDAPEVDRYVAPPGLELVNVLRGSLELH